MTGRWRQWQRRARYWMQSAGNAAAGSLVRFLLVAIRRCDRGPASDRAAGLMRTLGPWLPEHKIGRANLTAAFPEKSPAEIEAILRGVWDNLGRVGAEIAHLDHICSGDRYKRNYIDYTADNIARFLHVKDDGKPALIF